MASDLLDGRRFVELDGWKLHTMSTHGAIVQHEALVVIVESGSSKQPHSITLVEGKL